MKWYNNLKIGVKLAVGFGLIIILVIVLAGYSVITAKNINSKYSYMVEYPQQRLNVLMEANIGFVGARRALSHMTVMGGENGEASVGALSDEIDNLISEINSNLEDYKNLVNSDPELTSADKSERIETVDGVLALITQYYSNVVIPVTQANLDENWSDIIVIAEKYAQVSNDLIAGINSLQANAQKNVDSLNIETTAEVQLAILILVAISIFIVVLSIILAFLITRLTTKPLKRLVKLVSEVSEGDININMDRTDIPKDETGELTLDVYKLIDVIKSLIGDLSQLTHNISVEGDIDYRIETKKYEGAYCEMTTKINNFADEYIYDMEQVLSLLEQIGDGNFNAEIKKYPGKKVEINSRVDTLKDRLKCIYSELVNLAKSAAEGKLNVRADAEKYKGDWAELIGVLNSLMEIIAAPIHEAADVLGQVSAGNFNDMVKGDYKGDFLLIKNSINSTVANVGSYIDEISDVLGAMSKNNLDQEITLEYVGKFSNIKDALNNIINQFNIVISDISSAADQVASGAKMISDSSMTLAQGATEQASAVEELNATVLIINENTSLNAKNAREADDLSDASKGNAVRGDQDMNKMLTSMSGIKQSSDSIAKIIKVIEDIAFQTNLLALNAAVEAARAGQHGKGFSVVAEEVRSLAGKSHTAAKETAVLIEESIMRVNEGADIAGATANALQTIVGDVTKVADIITHIAKASNEQSVAVGQVREGLSQVSEVVQNNSATSEETASAAQELASQAEVMRNLISVFNLKRNYR